jgi:ATP-binding cassette subfamily F protein 3
MTLLVRNITKSFRDRVLFSDVSFSVGPGRKVALIGANGSGKTTLLNIIAGREEFDSGKIDMPIRNFRMGIMNQFYESDEKTTLLDDAITAGKEINSVRKRMDEIIERLNGESEKDTITRLSKEYADLEERFTFLGGYDFEREVRKMLRGIGFIEADLEKRVVDLSGGERSRLALAKLLIYKPHLMLLDEPTNHLDIEGVEWLEKYITEYKGACLMVSHDRYFVDNVAQVILELEDGEINSYTGNYRDYLRMKYEKIEHETKEYEKQRDEIQRLQKFINRWRANPKRHTQAKSREKMLQRIEPVKRPKRGQKQFSISIESDHQSFTKVLQIKGATKSYAGKPLFTDLEFEVLKGDNYAITGRNGQGKSTLLRCLMGRDTLDSGTFRWGGNTEIGYFAQDRIELDDRDNFLKAFHRNYPDWTEDECKQYLGSFYISLHDLEKPVSSLSGGEKSKLALAILIAKKPNVLILDEPTNHLDIVSSEALEMALENYNGTLILVSHDRRMLDRLADRTMYLKDGRGKEYLGNYSYMREKQAEEEVEKQKQINKPDSSVSESREAQTKKSKKINIYKLGQVEKKYEELNRLEKEIQRCHEKMADPQIAKDWKKLVDLQNELDDCQNNISSIQKEIEERERELFGSD